MQMYTKVVVAHKGSKTQFIGPEQTLGLPIENSKLPFEPIVI